MNKLSIYYFAGTSGEPAGYKCKICDGYVFTIEYTTTSPLVRYCSCKYRKVDTTNMNVGRTNE